MKKSISFFAARLALAAGGLALGACAMPATTTNAGTPTRTSLFTQYDRIQGSSTVETLVFIRSGLVSGPSVHLTLSAQHPDTAPPAPMPRVLLLFDSSSGTQTDGWRFLRNHDLALLVDDSVRMTLRGVHDGDVGTVLLRERIGFTIETQDLLRVGNASKVEGSLGGWRFALKPEEISRVREMALFASMDPDAPRPIRGRDR